MAEILDLNNENIEPQNQTSIEKIKFQSVDSGFDNITIGSIVENFNKINQNFSKISAAEYLKGDNGNNVKIIEVSFKLEDKATITKDEKPIYLNGSPVTGNVIATKIQKAIEILAKGTGLGPISGIEWYENLKDEQHISFIIEEENDIYNIKSSLWYVYNDPRFANPQDNSDYSELFNTSCVVYYDSEQFKAYQPFPTIYYHKTKGFCWKINNEETEISAQGIQGLPGNSYPVYIVKYDTKTVDKSEVEITSIFSEDKNDWVTVDTDINKYDNCTAICLPDIESGFASQSIYLSILKVYSNEQSSENPTRKLKAAVSDNVNLTSYFLADNLFNLMAKNSVKKLFIPYDPKDESSPIQVFEMTAENTLTTGIQNREATTDTILQLLYQKITAEGDITAKKQIIAEGNITTKGHINVGNTDIYGDSIQVNAGQGKVDGRATSLNWDLTQQSGDANKCYDSLSLRKYIVDHDINNMFPTSGNDNSILWIGGGSSGKQGHQLGFSNNGNIYHRVSKPSGNNDREYTSWYALNLRIINVTYNELVNLRNNNALIPGQKYRIIDFVSKFASEFKIDNKTYSIESAGHPFDIIIEAIDTKTLSENAKACLHDGETYFKNSKLEAWELKYCLDNNTERFNWATTGGKGVIYYMKDEFENEAFYDFKNLLFIHDYRDISGSNKFDEPYNILAKICIWNEAEQNENSSLSILLPGTREFQIKYYTFSYFELDNTRVPSSIQYRQENEYLSVTCSSDFSKQNTCRNNKILIPGVHNYQLRENIFINTNKTILNRSAYCGSNTLLNNCGENYFSQYTHSNTLNEYCQNNTIHHNSFENVLGKTCTNNVINHNCKFNIFEHYCSENILGEKCDNNTFGQSCRKNILGANCSRNTFGQGCISCSLEGYNRGSFNNIFENDCQNVHLTNIKFIVDNILKYGTSAYNILSNTWDEMDSVLASFKDNLLDYSYRNNKIGAGSQDLLIIPGIYSDGSNYKVGDSDTSLRDMSNSGYSDVKCTGFIYPFHKYAPVSYAQGLNTETDYSIQKISIYQNTAYFAYIANDQSYIKFNYYKISSPNTGQPELDYMQGTAEGWNVLLLKKDNAYILGIPVTNTPPRDITTTSISTKDKLFKILVYPMDGKYGVNTDQMVLYHPSSTGRTQFSNSF